MLEPEWKSFEVAVAEFLKRLEPGAQITHDVYLPDADTGKPRQRDVWVQARVAGVPIRILVSCKHYKRKLNQQDLDAFVGELSASNAHAGIVYSRSGFTDNAIEKGKARGISCCRLYQGQPADIPELIFFTTYLWRPIAEIVVVSGLDDRPTLTWQELFDCSDKDGSLLDQLDSACRLATDSTKQEIETGNARPDMIYVVNMGFDAIPGFGDFKVRVTHRWRVFRAKRASHSVMGSYAETDGTFLGQVVSPAIDTWSSEPGPGWEEVPASLAILAPNAVNLILPGGSSRASISANLGPRPVGRLPQAPGAQGCGDG